MLQKFSRNELELVDWNQWYVLTSLSWLDETLYARVRKPFRCSDWLAQFFKWNFSWRKLWVNLSMYIIILVLHPSSGVHTVKTAGSHHNYKESWLSLLFRPVPTSLDNCGLTVLCSKEFRWEEVVTTTLVRALQRGFALDATSRTEYMPHNSLNNNHYSWITEKKLSTIFNDDSNF